MYRTLRKISDTVNRMPFAGKPFIRMSIFWTVSGPQDSRIYRWALVLLLLAGFSYLHFVQATMGWETFISAALIVPKVIALLYTLVNGMVVYTQMFILIRVLKMIGRPSYRRSSAHHVEMYGMGYTMLCLIFTLTGQMIFLLIA